MFSCNDLIPPMMKCFVDYGIPSRGDYAHILCENQPRSLLSGSLLTGPPFIQLKHFKHESVEDTSSSTTLMMSSIRP